MSQRERDASRLTNGYNQMPPAQVIAGRSPRKPPNREPPADSSNHSKINFIAFKIQEVLCQARFESCTSDVQLKSTHFFTEPYDDFPQAPVI